MEQVQLDYVCLKCKKLAMYRVNGLCEECVPGGGMTVKLHGIDRVRLSRKRGSKMPANTLIVDRRSPFGNWVHVDKYANAPHCRMDDFGKGMIIYAPTNKQAVEIFREWVNDPKQERLREKFIQTVIDKQIEHLACWCSEEKDCHVNVWIEVWDNYVKSHDN